MNDGKQLKKQNNNSQEAPKETDESLKDGGGEQKKMNDGQGQKKQNQEAPKDSNGSARDDDGLEGIVDRLAKVHIEAGKKDAPEAKNSVIAKDNQDLASKEAEQDEVKEKGQNMTPGPSKLLSTSTPAVLLPGAVAVVTILPPPSSRAPTVVLTGPTPSPSPLPSLPSPPAPRMTAAEAMLDHMEYVIRHQDDDPLVFTPRRPGLLAILLARIRNLRNLLFQ